MPLLFRGLVHHAGFNEVAVLNQLGLSPTSWTPHCMPGNMTFASVRLPSTTPAGHPAMAPCFAVSRICLSFLWLRRSAGLDSAYSLVGLIHTIAPPAVRQEIAVAALSPTHPWDALVCTVARGAAGDGGDVRCPGRALRGSAGGDQSAAAAAALIPLAVDTERLA